MTQHIDDLRNILKRSIEDYNLWASIKGSGYDRVKSYTDLAGIFYNKILTVISTRWDVMQGYVTGKSRYNLARVFTPSDFDITFNNCNFIVAIKVKATVSNHVDNRNMLLINLTEALAKLDFSDVAITSPKEYDSTKQINDIVNQIQAFKV